MRRPTLRLRGPEEPPAHRAARVGRIGARPLAAFVLLVLVTAVCGCGREAAPPTDEAGRAQLMIESGNQAFVAGDFGLAARRYAAAAVIKKDDPAAYYGLGMALSKLGRDEDARAAYARARQLARH